VAASFALGAALRAGIAALLVEARILDEVAPPKTKMQEAQATTLNGNNADRQRYCLARGNIASGRV